MRACYPSPFQGSLELLALHTNRPRPPPELPPSSQPPVPFPFLLFLLPPLSHLSNTRSNALRPPDTPILSNWNICTQPLNMSKRKARGEEEEELVSLPSGDEESEEE
ncbi:hypothetical protein FJTKL_13288 [Diaporthe vaccinii]|uniref:Uncharacterized protein n=1 Tax=Diaporthe vaccinii TaxID=105482 RepID=A0ABR4EB06_9PEZI